MEFIEIILENVPVKFLKTVISRHLQVRRADILASHFFCPERGETLEYPDTEDWTAFFRGTGTSDIYLAELHIGMTLRNVVVLISHNAACGDITIHFEESQFSFADAGEARTNFKKLFARLMEISSDCKADGVLIGYEPAEDDDMRILEIRHGRLRVFYGNIFRSQALQVLCRTGEEAFPSA